MKKSELESACKIILTDKVYNAFKIAKISSPEIIKFAALECFISGLLEFKKEHPIKSSAASVIKETLLILNEVGILEFEDE